mgnify:CR=1 FL=1|jgi:hypothetical protein
MNLNNIINQILEEENVAGGATSALVTPDSSSTSSQFSGPNIYNPGDNRRAKLLLKKVQVRPWMKTPRRRKNKK